MFNTIKRGFTLIEILVVMLIIGIVTSTIIFKTASLSSPRAINSFAELLKNQMEVARQEAVLKTSVLGLRVNPDSYGFYLYTEDKEPKWVALSISDHFWKKYRIPKGIHLHILKVSHKENTQDLTRILDAPQIIIYPSGELSSFQLTLTSKDLKKYHIEIRGESNGNIYLQRENHE